MSFNNTLSVSTLWLACSALLAGVAGSHSVGQIRRPSCNQMVLGQAVMVDTTMLDKILVYRGAHSGSTEGVLVSAFLDGDSLKVLTATYFGELGKGIDTYYLLSREDYVVEHTELYYSQPIRMGDAHVISRFTQHFYFCGGDLVEFRYGERAEHVKGALEEFVSRLDKR
jgi:hypothetical protein